MNFYYDIIVNFNDNNPVFFYEWSKYDHIERIKKIPFFIIDKNKFIDICKNKIVVTSKFLNLIKNKTIKINDQKLLYCVLLSDRKNVIAIEFNEKGKSFSKSFLPYEDELNVLNYTHNLTKYNLEYQNISKELTLKNSRIEEKIKQIITLEIKTLEKNNNQLKINYLYFELFNQECLNNPVKEILNSLNKIDERHLNLVNIIKLSYKKSGLSS